MRERVLPARNTWGKRIPEFTVMAGEVNMDRAYGGSFEQANRAVLRDRFSCRFVMKHNSKRQHRFVEYTCPSEHGPFRLLLIDCDGEEDKPHPGWHYDSCKVTESARCHSDEGVTGRFNLKIQLIDVDLVS